MNNLTNQQKSLTTLIAFQANKFCPFTSHLPQDYDSKIARLDGVRDIVPIQVFTNNCRASLDVIVFYGLPAGKLKTIRDFELTAGTWEEFERHQDAAMVGQNIASRRDLSAGNKFSIGELTVTVAGVYSSDDESEENYIDTHLDFLQRRNGKNLVGTVTQFEVFLDGNVDPDAKCREIDDTFRSGQVATDTRTKGAFQAKSLGDLTQLIRLSHLLGYACVGLVLVLVATTTMMAVQDRIKEHAVLQTIGFSGPRIFVLVLAGSITLSLAGGVIGVGSALFILYLTNLSVGAEAVSIPFTPSIRLALTGLTVALGTGILAGLTPAWRRSPCRNRTGAAARVNELSCCPLVGPQSKCRSSRIHRCRFLAIRLAAKRFLLPAARSRLNTTTTTRYSRLRVARDAVPQS